MANVINLQVVSCTSSDNGGFILKLLNEGEEKTVKTPFGQKTSKSQTTFYMKVDTKQKVGFSADMDIDDFKIVEREYTIPDEDEDGKPNKDAGKSIGLKWLHFKD